MNNSGQIYSGELTCRNAEVQMKYCYYDINYSTVDPLLTKYESVNFRIQ